MAYIPCYTTFLAMEKIVTETGKNKIKIKTTRNQLELTVDRGGWYESQRTIKLSKRQVQKLIDELQSALKNWVTEQCIKALKIE